MSKPTDGWEKLGDRYYRKIQLYTSVFDEDIELENYIISGAPYSGALALHRDESKIRAFRGGDAARSSIDIYSSAGKLIRRLDWDQGIIKGLGWSEDEKLLVVAQDGAVRCYSDLSDDFTPFSLGHEAEEQGVVECRFWATGFVAMLGDNRLVEVSNYVEPRPRVLATPPSDEVMSWSIVPPAYSLSRSVEVLLAIGQTINVVDVNDSEDRMLQNGPFRHICVSPNGKFVALYTEDAKVWVISSDFQDKLSEYDTKVKSVPKDMQWCGNDAVILAWEDEVHLLGPNGAATKYYYDSWVHLVPDVDGLRIFTNDVCEFVQGIADVTEDTFKVGSTSPSAVLLDAVEQLEKRSPKADDNIQLIKPNLIHAVDSCIAAAGYEYSIHWQKQLLKAASFGKTVLDLYDSDDFVSMVESIRVLNAVRFFEIGLPLSYDQYIRLTPERLITRLVARHEYLLAVRLSDTLRLPTDRIYVHWACEKARRAAEDDEATARLIVNKISTQRGISYDEVARVAFDEGRTHLATQLLNHEPLAGKQVPLLLSMDQGALALDKAIESGDTDLVLISLLHLRQKLPLASFFRTINSRPVATALVEATARADDREMLKDLYYQDDRRNDGAMLLYADALAQKDTQTTLARLRPALNLLQETKDLAPQARLVEDTAKLLRAQEALDADESLRPPSAEGQEPQQRVRFKGLPLNETIYRLFLMGQGKRALKLQAEHKMSERAFWWLRLRAQVAGRSWRDLEEFGTKTKKSPIGWEAFFNEVLGAGNSKLAGSVFVPKCTGLTPRERADMYLRCGMIAKAAEEGAKAKDGEFLESLRGKAQGREVAEVERLINVLAKGR
ncbi:hypothetical protein FH972_022814 [Carpinus fangiana]|uniref:Protein VACUOLELESS1 n=1 Tax=Carpinus fangiana TaxID=176857 RepID=A0A5N6KTB7_9ROSI|nr:hypothetical protein FH972_022814 [Carpinus fangiana]